MSDREDTSVRDGLVISYLALRTAVGIVGVALPPVLSGGCLLLGDCRSIERSISAYYGTGMRDVFVGLLFAIAFFMFAYRGIDERDDRAGNLACAFAIGVALFPTTSAVTWVRVAHFLSAAALFLTLSYFSLRLFTLTKEGERPTPEKLARNKVYVVCGFVMLACIVLIASYQLFLSSTVLAELKPVFWLESLALWAFGLSWMTKGEVILEDR